MNLYEFGRWKQQIVEKLAADPNIREILLPAPQPEAGGETPLSATPAPDLSEYLFNYEHIPGAQDEPKALIGLEAAAPKVTGRGAFQVVLSVYALCHKSLLSTYSRAGVQGTRVDVLCADIDRLVSGLGGLGIGAAALTAVERYAPAPDYYGRVLTYSIPAFNR